MASEKQIAANRRNALRSTGPVTREGKARSSRNALRHGLSRSIFGAGMAGAEVGEFAHQLVGDEVSAAALDLATAAVEAQLDLARIRREHQRILEHDLLGDVGGGEAPADLQTIKRLVSIDRYERRAESLRKKALRRLSHLCRLPIFK
jgi:hypothetical protein